MATMRAVRLHESGLKVEEVPVPVVGPGEALVHVHAAALTRDELEWPVERLPAIPSYELSGVVAAVAPDVSRVAVGDEVYALAGFDRDGAAAELALVRADLLAPKPAALDHVESAAVPLAALSAWQGLFDLGGLTAGERVLVLGAAGGVGHFATQLGRVRGARVVGVATGDGVARARELGAEETLDGGAAAFEDGVEPVDLVFDTVGGEALVRAAALLRDGGRLVSVAAEPPAEIAAARQASYFVVEPNREQLVELARLVDDGAVRPEVDSVFPLAEAEAAFARVAASGKRGKVVLRVVDG
jgi:NADPH:quinone reductase-like Zn-dependent oxidoreductase